MWSIQSSERNQHLYGTDSDRLQYLNDEAELPRADLLVIKDVLQYLPNSEIHYISRYLERYTCALVTNTVTSDLRRPDGTFIRIANVNSDLIAGGMRPVNVLTEPFNWPGNEVHRYSCLWPRLGAWEMKSTALISVSNPSVLNLFQ